MNRCCRVTRQVHQSTRRPSHSPLDLTNLCGVVTPGDPGGSTIYQRVSSRPGMPSIATLETDQVAIDVVDDWIRSIASCP